MVKHWSPNALTAVRFTCGIVSIAAAVQGYWLVAMGLVFIAALFDNWANHVARRLNAIARFARDIDLLSDLLVFGLAPATLYFFTHFVQSGAKGYLLALAYPAAAAVRLARHTVDGTKGYFFGMPLVIAGPALAGLALFGPMLPTAFHAMAVLCISALVLSNVRITKLW